MNVSIFPWAFFLIIETEIITVTFHFIVLMRKTFEYRIILLPQIKDFITLTKIFSEQSTWISSKLILIRYIETLFFAADTIFTFTIIVLFDTISLSRSYRAANKFTNIHFFAKYRRENLGSNYFQFPEGHPDP